jgi:soluble lytic murein transglycosylase-like protein
MQKTWLTCACLALCLAVSASVAFGSPYPEADRYYAVRDKTRPVVENVTFAQVQASAVPWKNALIEVRGVITGCARRDDGGTFIVTREAGDTFVIEANQKLPESMVDIARTVRVLARVPVDRSSFSNLQLVAVTSEYEAASLEIERAKRPAASRPAVRIASRPPARASSRRKAVRKALSRRAALRQSRSRQTMLASRGLDLLSQYATAVQWFNPRLSDDDARRLAQSIIYYSYHHDLDARLIMAVIAVESNFNVNAVSPKGAMGLGQLMPGTADDLGVADPWSPNQNLEGAARLLRGHLRRFGPVQQPTWEQIKLALACYNAGAGAVRKHGGVPPYRETRNYVKKVGRLYYQMCGLTPPE